MKPVELNATIYNNLVKVFNDAACSPHYKQVRDQILAMRKRFPTYSELKESGVKFVSAPTFVDENDEPQVVKSWIGNDDDNNYADILECKYVYCIGLACIGLARDANPESTQACIALKIRGILKGE